MKLQEDSPGLSKNQELQLKHLEERKQALLRHIGNAEKVLKEESQNIVNCEVTLSSVRSKKLILSNSKDYR